MLDLHSGSEYGAARIAAMIAAAVTIVLTVLAAFGSMVPYAQADSFGALTINAVWGRDGFAQIACRRHLFHRARRHRHNEQ